jgi:hypothetical protein
MTLLTPEEQLEADAMQLCDELSRDQSDEALQRLCEFLKRSPAHERAFNSTAELMNWFEMHREEITAALKERSPMCTGESRDEHH